MLIKGGIKDWPALKKWNKKYFNEIFNDRKISVAVTPNGYADAIAEKIIDGKTVECFVLPEERFMTITEFLNKLEGGQMCMGMHSLTFCQFMLSQHQLIMFFCRSIS